MNTNKLKISKILPTTKEDVFKYFTRPELIEKWSYPEGMTLKVPKFEGRSGGRYRYEHTGKDGKYLCEGRVTDLVPNEKLVLLDEYINGPDGKCLAENLENIITLNNTVGGTEVTIEVKGNFDEKFLKDCETGWNQSIEHLNDLIARDTGRGTESKAGEVRPSI